MLLFLFILSSILTLECHCGIAMTNICLYLGGLHMYSIIVVNYF